MTDPAIGSDEIVNALLSAPEGRGVCLLDSCGVGKPGSNLLIAGVDPFRTVRWNGADPDKTLEEFQELIGSEDAASVFSISYDFGAALHNVPAKRTSPEPDIFVAQFNSLLLHDYQRRSTRVLGPGDPEPIVRITATRARNEPLLNPADGRPSLSSNLTEAVYISLIEQIKEQIRSGETYQTNLTQQITANLPEGLSASAVFGRLRHKNPAPFAAYLDRGDSHVISASPELFFAVSDAEDGRQILASPIKGTRPRGRSKAEDGQFLQELAESTKDRAENTMIVDLMRNDLGRVCEFGTVKVTDLCSVENHPTLFQMVSTVQGNLRNDVGIAEILRSVFPCGSITGAPKLRTMEIIDRLEPDPRGLSMGAIGCRIPESFTGTGEVFESSVAIRTMVIRNRTAVFNVGGGVVIDSDPLSEYEESMLKARALLDSLGFGVES